MSKLVNDSDGRMSRSSDKPPIVQNISRQSKALVKEQNMKKKQQSSNSLHNQGKKKQDLSNEHNSMLKNNNISSASYLPLMVPASDFIALNKESSPHNQQPSMARYQNLSSSNLANNLKKDFSDIIDDSKRTPVQKISKKGKKKTKEPMAQNIKADIFYSANDHKQSSNRSVHKSQMPFASASHKKLTSDSMGSNAHSFQQRVFGIKELEKQGVRDSLGNPRMGMQATADDNHIDLSESILASNDKRKSMVNPQQTTNKTTVTSRRKKPANLMPAPKSGNTSMQSSKFNNYRVAKDFQIFNSSIQKKQSLPEKKEQTTLGESTSLRNITPSVAFADQDLDVRQQLSSSIVKGGNISQIKAQNAAPSVIHGAVVNSGQIKPKTRRKMPVVNMNEYAANSNQLPTPNSSNIEEQKVLYFNAHNSMQQQNQVKASPFSNPVDRRITSRNIFSQQQVHTDAGAAQVVHRMSSKSPHPQPLNQSRQTLVGSQFKNNHKSNKPSQHDNVTARRGDLDESQPVITGQASSSSPKDLEHIGSPEIDMMSSEANLPDIIQKNFMQKHLLRKVNEENQSQSASMSQQLEQRHNKIIGPQTTLKNLSKHNELNSPFLASLKVSKDNKQKNVSKNKKQIPQENQFEVTKKSEKMFNPQGQIFFNKHLEMNNSQVANVTLPRRTNVISETDQLRRSLPLRSKISIDQSSNQTSVRLQASDMKTQKVFTIADLEDSSRSGEAEHNTSSGGKISDDEHQGHVFSNSIGKMPSSLFNRHSNTHAPGVQFTYEGNSPSPSQKRQPDFSDRDESPNKPPIQMEEQLTGSKNRTFSLFGAIFGGKGDKTKQQQIQSRNFKTNHEISKKTQNSPTVQQFNRSRSGEIGRLQMKPKVNFESPRQNKKRPLFSHNFKCSCAPSSEPYACERAYTWLLQANNGREFDAVKNRQLYLGLLGTESISGSEHQIKLDICRTFPQMKDFQEKTGEGQLSLQRVLCAYSRYDSGIGYVQGMNFIVGSLLYHCSEEVAFWLFVSLIEDYDMRDIYQPDLPGLYKHCGIMQELLGQQLGKLLTHLEEISITFEMYASDWIFALFGNIIPCEQMQYFFDNFFADGWCFFYKLTLTLMRIFQPKILECDEMSDVIDIIKLQNRKPSQRAQGELDSNNVLQASSQSLQMLLASQEDESDSEKQDSKQAEKKPGFFGKLGSLLFKKKQSENDFSWVKFRGVSIDDIELSIFYEDKDQLETNMHLWQDIIELSLEMWEKRLPPHVIIGMLKMYDAENLKKLELQFQAQAKQEETENNLFKSPRSSELASQNRSEQIQSIMKQQKDRHSNPSPYIHMKQNRLLEDVFVSDEIENNPFATSFTHLDKDNSSLPDLVSDQSDLKQRPVQLSQSPAKVHQSSFRGPYKKQQLMQKMKQFAQ